MDIITIIIISIALAMDAFSVSITKGFTLKNITKMQILWFGIFFGGFQALMPLLGYISGSQLEQFVTSITPWIAFLLLLFIGLKMIYDSLKEDEEDIKENTNKNTNENINKNINENTNKNINENENKIYTKISKDKFSFKELTLLAIATSIDAFAVGVTFAILKTPIIIPILFIGIVSFILSEIGIIIGQKIGHFFGNKFEIVGGIVLVLLGFKILLEGIGIF